MRAALLVLAMACAGGAAAADVPSPDYFTGLYERVGRSGGAGDAGLIDDLVHLAPDPAGEGLLMTVCLPEGAPGHAPLPLAFETFGDVPNLLIGADGTAELYCQFFNDAANYPVIVCQSGEGARFTLWAAPDAGTGCP